MSYGNWARVTFVVLNIRLEYFKSNPRRIVVLKVARRRRVINRRQKKSIARYGRRGVDFAAYENYLAVIVQLCKQGTLMPTADLNKRGFQGALASIAFVVTAAVATSASAASVEIARKCAALTAKAFPPRVVGNPAAGSAKGTGSEKRDFYKKCVANEGKSEAPEK